MFLQPIRMGHRPPILVNRWEASHLHDADTHHGVQAVDHANGDHPGVRLADSRPVHHRGGAAITGAGVNACDAHHVVSSSFPHERMSLRSGFAELGHHIEFQSLVLGPGDDDVASLDWRRERAVRRVQRLDGDP